MSRLASCDGNSTARRPWSNVHVHFELSVGQDFSIGYLSHDTEKVNLYIEESFTFLVLTDQAAVPLTVKKS